MYCDCRPEAAVAESVLIVCRVWLHWLRRRHAPGSRPGYFPLDGSWGDSSPLKRKKLAKI